MVREQTTHLAQPDSRGGRHHTRAQGKFRAHLIVNWRWGIACVRVCVCLGMSFVHECLVGVGQRRAPMAAAKKKKWLLKI